VGAIVIQEMITETFLIESLCENYVTRFIREPRHPFSHMLLEFRSDALNLTCFFEVFFKRCDLLYRLEISHIIGVKENETGLHYSQDEG